VRGRPAPVCRKLTAIIFRRERAEKLASVRAELAKNAPPIDYAAAYDSLDIMEKVMRHFYLRALIEELAEMSCRSSAGLHRAEHRRTEGKPDTFGRPVRADVHLIALHGGLDHREQPGAVVVNRKRARDKVGPIS
jgi:hypothetical protein